MSGEPRWRIDVSVSEPTQPPNQPRTTGGLVHHTTPDSPASPTPRSHYYVVRSPAAEPSIPFTPTPPPRPRYLTFTTPSHDYYASPLTRTPPHSYTPSPSAPQLAAVSAGPSLRLSFPTPPPRPPRPPAVLLRKRMAASSPQFHLRDSPQHWVAAEHSSTRPPLNNNGLGIQLANIAGGQYRPSQTHVDFHHARDMDDTFVDVRDDSTFNNVSRRSAGDNHSTHTPSPSTTISAYPSSLPSTINWPLHQHPLVYAGTSSGNSVHICKCRNCGSEHYNTALYSCIERGCNFHICIQCALEQITAFREQERQQQANRRAGKGNGGLIAEAKYEEDDDAVDVDMTQRVPIKATGGINRVSRISRRWMTSVAASASSIGIPLLYTSAHHPHPLLFTPVTPFHLHGHIEDKLHTHTPLLSSISADRWNCSSTASHTCIAYQSPSLTSSIPTYSCSQCAYRICFPCLRHQHIKQTTTTATTQPVGVQTSQASQQRREALAQLRNNRIIEAAVDTYCNVVHSEQSLHHRQRLGNYIIGFSSFLAVLLLNAMLPLWTGLTDYIANEWTNVIIMLTFSSLAAICMKAVNRLILSNQQHLTQAMLRLCNYYQELDFQQLLVPQGKHTPPSSMRLPVSVANDQVIVLNYRIRLSHLTPRQKHIVSAVYYLHSEIFRYQNNTPLVSLLSLFFLIAAEGLLAAAILVLFVVVLCRLPGNTQLGDCQVRLGVPLGVGVFGALVILHLGEMVRAGWAFITKGLHRL